MRSFPHLAFYMGDNREEVVVRYDRLNAWMCVDGKRRISRDDPVSMAIE